MNADLRSLRHQPFEQLVRLEERLRAARLDAVTGQAQAWVGLGFRAGDLWLTTPKGDVREVAVPPRLTRVPNARPWLLGVANLRGNLLTVVDLRQLIDGTASTESRASRVLVFNSDRLPVGYRVDEVVGYRSFGVSEQRRELVQSATAQWRPWLLGGFVRDGQPWLALSLQKLADSALLKQAGW